MYMKMKHSLLTMLCLGAFMLWQAEAGAQELTLARNNSKVARTGAPDQYRQLKGVVQDLKKRFGADFIYENNTLEGRSVIYDPAQHQDLEEVLAELLPSVNLSYRKIDQNVYAIVPRPAVGRKANKAQGTDLTLAEPQARVLVPTLSIGNLAPRLVLGQFDRRISGRVISTEDNQGLPAVNILLKGTTTGTVTDVDGRYTLTVPDNGGTLVFSYVGFVTQEIVVGTSNVINVSLVPDTQTLEQVVVIGYGTQKREVVTGAITTVSSKEVAALPVPNLGAALQGRVAGVTVTNNGAPGEGPIVRIRGIGALTGTSTPLYVVDGFPTSDLNSFDTRDIESVEVLRDASTAAIYGSRGANGVIMITTKKGKRNSKLSVNVDTYWGVQSAWRQLDLLDRDGYIRYATALLTTHQRGQRPASPVRQPEPTDLRRGLPDLCPNQHRLARCHVPPGFHSPAYHQPLGRQRQVPLLCLGRLL